MTDDQRDSIHLWVWVAALFGLAWGITRFDLFHGVAEKLQSMSDVFGLLGLISFARGIWQRRASNPRNPNRRP